MPPREKGPDSDVVEVCRELIRIDTTNTGDPRTTVGEAAAAEYVEGFLRAAGYDPHRFCTVAGTRQGVLLRIAGRDPGRPALLVHGHLDVVAAQSADWTVDPFGAEIADGMVWGRGAVDMKDMDAMILSVAAHWARTGYRPPRDVVLLFTPDEEAGGVNGAHWIVDHHPEWLAGVSEALGEVGGFSLTVREGLRVYFLQVAEKGIAWLRMSADGIAGHGSLVNDDNAVTRLAAAVAAVGGYDFPVQPTEAVDQMVRHLSDALGQQFDVHDPEPILRALGPMRRMIEPGFRNTANPTMLLAGYKVNVIPGRAEARVDGRFVPGQRDDLVSRVRSAAGPGVDVHVDHEDAAVETSFDGPLVAAIDAALRQEDPAAHVVPYLMSGGTDAKAWHRLGIRCYGFAPLRLPEDLDFASLFHGVDERVPIDGLMFGARVLDGLLRRC